MTYILDFTAELGKLVKFPVVQNEIHSMQSRLYWANEIFWTWYNIAECYFISL